mmetsp:Transcript_105098/g.128304  ORF Transcript_105098/g.128304 Transcript_105098/m.128304 type:complete len:422 (-) Transcript_105098:318-1583(-)
MAILALLLCVLFVVRITNSHSWAACVDYEKASELVSGHVYDDDACKGYIREWGSYGTSYFSQDRGVNYIANGAGNLCHKDIKPGNNYAESYSSQYPMPTYSVGEEVTVLWPAKNHANYECKNFIPDTSMKLYMNSAVNPTSDLATIGEWTLVKDWHEGCSPMSDGCGFQNCIDFCQKTDASICHGTFTVPQVQESGVYTFIWYWIFNPGAPYTNCWEAYISTTPLPPGQSLSPTKKPTMTSNPTETGKTADPTQKPTPNPTRGDLTFAPTRAFEAGLIIDVIQANGFLIVIQIRNLPVTCKLTTVELRPSNYASTNYVTGEPLTTAPYEDTPYVFKFNLEGTNEFQTPITVRVTTDEIFGDETEIITAANLISSFTAQTLNMGANFACVDPPSSLSTSNGFVFFNSKLIFSLIVFIVFILI